MKQAVHSSHNRSLFQLCPRRSTRSHSWLGDCQGSHPCTTLVGIILRRHTRLEDQDGMRPMTWHRRDRRTPLTLKGYPHMCILDSLFQNAKVGGRQHLSQRVRKLHWWDSKHTQYSHIGLGLVASSAATTNGKNERTAKAIAWRADGLLAVHGIQSRTIGDELAWGRTPAEVSGIFYFLYFNFHIIFCIYLIISI
jgi:hypothetical protein